MQAARAGLAPSVRFNPVLLKPGSDRTSQRGGARQVAGTMAAGDYLTRRAPARRGRQRRDLAALRRRIRRGDLRGRRLAGRDQPAGHRPGEHGPGPRRATCRWWWSATSTAAACSPHLFGTVAVLEPEDQKLIGGFLVNKFRGDPALLEPGLRQLQRLTGRPTLRRASRTCDGLWLDAEDSLSVHGRRRSAGRSPPRGDGRG